MKHRQLGKSDLEVSEIGFGCMSLELKNSDNSRLIDLAIDQGINYFDTADLYQYGENEKWLGRALEGRRSSVVLASKVGNEWTNSSEGWSWNPGKDYLIKATEASLQRLKTDYVDLIQLHGGTIEDPFEEVIEAFETLKTQGKIRQYGISSIRPNVIRRFLAHGGITSNMLQYSLLDRRPEESVLDEMKSAGISALARGVLAKGLLAGKGPSSYFSLTEAQIEKTQKELSGFGDLQTLAQHYVLRQSSVASLILGIRTADQLSAALEAYKKGNDLEVEWDQIKAILPYLKYENHR